MLRKSSQPLLSDKLLQHDDVLRPNGNVLCARTDVLRAGSHVLCSSTQLLRPGGERQCGTGRCSCPDPGDSPGSSPRRLKKGCCQHDDRPGSRGGRCPKEPGL